MFLLDYEEIAPLGDGLYPSNSAGQVGHHLEPWSYQAPSTGYRHGSYTDPRQRRKGKIIRGNGERPLCSETNKALLIQARRASRFELLLNYQGTWGKQTPFLFRRGGGRGAGDHTKTLSDKNKLPSTSLPGVPNFTHSFVDHWTGIGVGESFKQIHSPHVAFLGHSLVKATPVLNASVRLLSYLRETTKWRQQRVT